MAKAAGQIACPGPNVVMYYSRGVKDDNGKLVPDTHAFCCQEPVIVDASPKQIIEQRVGSRGQLLIKVAENDLGWHFATVSHFLDQPDPIPSSVVVLDKHGDQILRSPIEG